MTMPSPATKETPLRPPVAAILATLAVALSGAALLLSTPPADAAEGEDGGGILPLLQASGPAAPAPDPVAAVRDTLARFASAWYEGNAPRMAGVLHPDFVRHVVVHAPDAPDAVETQSGLGWIDWTDRGYGRNTAPSDRKADVSQLQVEGGVAQATLQLADHAERLQLVRWNNGWRVLHAATERDAGAGK